MFIHNDCNDPNLDWEIVNLSTFDSIVIRQQNLFEVRARRILCDKEKQEKTMFRILLLIAWAIYMMTGCGSEDPKDPTPAPDADESLIGSWERFGRYPVGIGFDLPEDIKLDVTEDTIVFASTGTWTHDISIKYTGDFSTLASDAKDPPAADAIDNIANVGKVASGKETLSMAATAKGRYTIEGNRITLTLDDGTVTLNPAELWKKYLDVTKEAFLDNMRDAYPISGTFRISDGKLTLTDDEGEKTLFNRAN